MNVTPTMDPRTGADGRERGMNGDAKLHDLAGALGRETVAVRDLREALVRQRAGVASDSTSAVHASCDDISRILVTLDTARRHRAALLGALVTAVPATIDALVAERGPLPQPLTDAIAELRAEAEKTAHEAAVNRRVLERTVEAGEAFLQALFTTANPHDPVYRPGERREDEKSGFLLDRKV